MDHSAHPRPTVTTTTVIEASGTVPPVCVVQRDVATQMAVTVTIASDSFGRVSAPIISSVCGSLLDGVLRQSDGSTRLAM